LPSLAAAALARLGALSDPTRRAIFGSLDGTPRAVGEIAIRFPISRPAVSQHLRALREAGLVIETRAGTRHLFAVDAGAALELRDYFQAVWEMALAAYARHVTEEERKHGRSRR